MRLFPHSSRAVLPTLISLALPPGLVAQQSGSQEVLELPTYTVTAERELPPPETWFYTRIDGFEVLSNSSESQSRDLLNEFQRFAHALNLVWPGVTPRAGAPVALVICGRGDKFGPFRPPAAASIDKAMVSLTLRSREQAAIVLDLQTKVLNLATAEGSTSAAAPTDETTEGTGGDPGLAVDAYRQLYREYIRFLLSGLDSPSPAWFSEGLAQIFMAMEVTESSITLGKLADPNLVPAAPVGGWAAPQEDRDFNAALARKHLMPMTEMFAVSRDSAEALNPLGTTWAKQCYAFVHWGLYGDQGSHQKAFLTFITRLERESLNETLFKDCFKQSYRDMLFTLRSYIETTRYKVAGLKAEKGQKIPVPPPVQLREATQAEVGRIYGDTLLLAGHPTEARTAYVTAYRRGERDPALLAAIGLVELAAGDVERARKFLDASVAGKAARPRAYLELSRLRLAESLAKPQGESGKLSPTQTAAVLDPLFTVRDQPPALPEIYELMAEIWSHSAMRPTTVHLAAIEQGVKLFPRNAALVYRAAELRARHGFAAEAHSLVRLGLRVAPDAPTRTRFEQLQASLPPQPPATGNN